MSGVYWCCCSAGLPPNPCPCQCVCNNPYQFYNEGEAIYPAKRLGSLYTEETLLPGNGTPFAIVMWPWSCLNRENGSLWHTYKDNGTTLTQHLLAYVSDLTEQVIWQIRMTNGSSFQTSQVELDLDDGELPGMCKLLIFQYREITGGWELQIFMRYNSGVEGGPVNIADVSASQTFTGSGWYPDLPTYGLKTWVGDYVSRCDPLWAEITTINIGFGGCISNLTLYEEWLNETAIDALWNEWEGIIDDTAEEQWCATYNWCGNQQVGSINNSILTPVCIIHDHNGDAITDDDGLYLCTSP